MEGRRVSFCDGGHAVVTGDDDKHIKVVPTGTAVDLTITGRDKDNALLDATLEISTVNRSGKNELERIARTFEIVKEVRLGETKEIILERRGTIRTVMKVKAMEVKH